MSRSRRKTPIFGHTTADSDRPWKQAAARRRVRPHLKATLDGDRFAGKRWDLVNPWSSEKDGKRWWGKADAKDMRK
jgi:hypothetical protein